MAYRIVRAVPQDAEELLKVQKLAYRSEAERYNNFDIPPLRQTLDEILAEFNTHILLKAVSQGRIAGTVRAFEKKGTCHIGRLAVLPDMQNKGIGTALIREIENHYNTCRRFELFTGAESSKNISLYQRLGYHIFKTEKYGCGEIEIVYLEKKRTPWSEL